MKSDVTIDISNKPVKIPCGEYLAVCMRHETAPAFTTPKVYIWFSILEPDDYQGYEVYAAFNVQKHRSKPKKNGSFVIRKHHKLTSTLIRLLSSRFSVKEMKVDLLHGKLCRISTRLVTKSYRQRDLPPLLQYSVVDEIVSVEH